jgi:hypothetical protein
MKVPAAMQRMITTSVVSMTPFCSKHTHSRAETAKSVFEVVRTWDVLIRYGCPGQQAAVTKEP